MIEHLKWLNAQERQTIEEFSCLLLRAADALEAKRWDTVNRADLDLIAQLREAAR